MTLDNLATWAAQIPAYVWTTLILWLCIGATLDRVGRWFLPEKWQGFIVGLTLLPFVPIILPIWLLIYPARALWRKIKSKRALRRLTLDGWVAHKGYLRSMPGSLCRWPKELTRTDIAGMGRFGLGLQPTGEPPKDAQYTGDQITGLRREIKALDERVGNIEWDQYGERRRQG